MEKKKVFVIMPFQEVFFEVFEMLKLKFKDDFVFSNAADEANQQNILKDIIQPIYEADIIIADLTGLNANVMYELGLAHTFNKKTIIITQDDLSSLPFDLKQYRAKDYNIHFKKFEELIEYLKTNLYGAIKGNVSFSNPVKDFLRLEKIEDSSWFIENEEIILDEETNKGFIDYLADIDLDAEKLTGIIINMSNDLQDLNDGVSNSSQEIERVKKNGGNGLAAFARKETKKIAGCLDDFRTKLINHNISIEESWNNIEKNTLGLLENKFAANENNRGDLIHYLTSLYNLKVQIANSNLSVESMKTALQGCLGLQRSMNQSIRFLLTDLSTYINITERIQSSIEKILDKSKFIVGTIDYSSI